MRSKKASLGIGTLVIFIAMILVAGLAASTLIQTAMSLQNKALHTGKLATSMISTNAMVLDVDRKTNELNTSITEYAIKTKLAPGSDGIKLTGSLLSIESVNASYNLLFVDKPCVYNETDGFYTDSANENGTYSVSYLIRGSLQRDGYFQRGDIIDICFAFPKQSTEDRIARIDFIPQNGIPATILEGRIR